MTEDPLLQATQALRELTASEEDGRRTRAAILSKLAQREAQPFRPLRWFPVAALLIGSTAFAASQGAFSRLIGAMLVSPVGPSNESTKPPLKHPPRIQKVLPTPSALATEEPASSNGSPSSLVKAPKEGRPSTRVPAGAPATVVPAAELEAYRTAHALHFQAHKWAAAADAWSHYLELAPNGSLAPEARFNRALCWIRTGDISSAKAALSPFAEGQVGGYRKAEAARLLAALAERE